MSEKEFISELKKLNINVSTLQLEQLNKYYELLIEWNKVMNLTSITEKKEVYLKHFYDSITISKIIDLNNYSTLCDIGTGAGFPGIIIKIFYPNLNVTLVDSLNKRINFLNTVIKELNLTNICAIHSRIEEFKGTFDIVTARAVSKLNILLEYSIPLVKLNGYFIPLKANILDELENSKNAFKELKCKLVEKQEFLLPIENSNRTILKIEKLGINNKYPRKYSEIKKKPL
jgi:16S rRNA (guanine527-N7)-methyltransferase